MLIGIESFIVLEGIVSNASGKGMNSVDFSIEKEPSCIFDSALFVSVALGVISGNENSFRWITAVSYIALALSDISDGDLIFTDESDYHGKSGSWKFLDKGRKTVFLPDHRCSFYLLSQLHIQCLEQIFESCLVLFLLHCFTPLQGLGNLVCCYFCKVRTTVAINNKKGREVGGDWGESGKVFHVMLPAADGSRDVVKFE